MKINIAEAVGKGYATFWKDKHFFRVLKGGRGSKKSKTMALWSIYNIMKQPESNMVVVRQVLNTHRDSTFAELQWAAERLGVSKQWYFPKGDNSTMKATYKPTGQVILFRGFDDVLKLTSITVKKGYLCWAWIEEAYEISDESKFDTFVESIRGIVPEHLWKQITLTYNPWVNAHWTKRKFWDVEHPQASRYTTTHKCNEFMDAADHNRIERLAIVDPDRYKVVGLGDYGIPGGVFFGEFRNKIHVTEHFDPPTGWYRYTSTDYGLDMLATYWIAIDYEGTAWVYRELYEPDLIIHDASEKMIAFNSNDKVRIRYGPPDLFARNKTNGKTTWGMFQQYGWNMFPSDNNREVGAAAMKDWLRPIERKNVQTGETEMTSRLKIMDNCKNLIRSLPQLQTDEKDPNKYATEPHDLTHGPDALRYFCVMHQPRPEKDRPMSIVDQFDGKKKDTRQSLAGNFYR